MVHVCASTSIKSGRDAFTSMHTRLKVGRFTVHSMTHLCTETRATLPGLPPVVFRQKAGKRAPGRLELAWAVVFAYASLVHDQHSVVPQDGLQPVRDGEHGALAERVLQHRLDSVVRLRVHIRSRLVHD